MSRPVGVLMSTPSHALTKTPPAAWIRSIESSTSGRESPIWLSLVITIPSLSRASTRSSACRSAGAASDDRSPTGSSKMRPSRQPRAAAQCAICHR